MDKVHLLGNISPSEPKISIQDIPAVTWLWQEQSFSFEFRAFIANSSVDIECSLPLYKVEFLPEIQRRAYDFARAAVNLAAFIKGYGLTIRLDEFVDPTGVKTTLLPEDKRLPPLVTAANGASGFDQLFRIVATDPTLIQLLGELIHAITVPHEAVTSCALAIDGLKNLIVGIDAGNKAAWQKMCEVLRVDEAYLKYITDNSKNSRHGKGVQIEGNITSEVAARSWVVMNRFLEYKKRGNSSLQEEEFPTLKG